MSQIIELLKKIFPKQSVKEYGQILVEYHGGGYDGCFWEWNYSLIEFIDGEEVVDNFISTGSLGCKSTDALFRRIDEYKQNNYSPINIYIIPSEWDKAEKEIPLSFLPAVAGRLELPIKCSNCGEATTVVAGIGYHGIGGIVSGPTGLVCEDCWCSNLCECCNEYYTEGLNADNLCEYCAENNDE